MLKHIFDIKQESLLKLKLNAEDALLLSHIKKISYKRNHDGYGFFHVDYTDISNKFPIIGGKRNLMRRISKYKKLGLIERKLKNKIEKMV